MWKRISVVAAAIGLAALAWFLWAGAGPVEASAADDSPGGVDRAAIIKAKSDARARGDVVLTPCSASGRVTRDADGKGIAGALVLLTPKGLEQGVSQTPGRRTEPLTVRTDAAGGWGFDAIPPGGYTVSATADGFLPAADKNVTLAAGQKNGGVDLALRAGGHPLRGTVSDIGGGPVPAALVSVARIDEGGMMNMNKAAYATLSDEDGRYAVNLPPGNYVATAQHSEYVTETVLTVISGGPKDENFRLAPAGVIEGVVLTRDGRKPLAGATVTFAVQDDAIANASGFNMSAMMGSRLVTDDDGRFRMTGLGSGVIQISAVSDGYGTLQPTEVPLGVADQVDGVEVLVDRAFKISGFIVHRGREDGDGLAGVMVGAWSFSPPTLIPSSSPSQSDGYFEIRGVQPGNYTIGAMGDAGLPNLMGTSAQVTDKDVTDVLVVMDAGVAVRGRVEPPGEADIKVGIDEDNLGFSGMLDAISNAMVQARSLPDGSFILRPVSAGKLELIAEGTDGSKGTLELDIGEDGASEVVIRMAPRPSAAGRVVDADGKPVAGAIVRMTPRKTSAFNFNFGPFSGGVATQEDGTFEVPGLDPGEYDLMVSDRKRHALAWASPDDPDHPTDPISVEVSDDVTGLELSVEARNGVIRGLVLDTEGQPLADAWVTASREESNREWITSMSGRRRKSKEDQITAEVPKDEDEGEDTDDKANIPKFFAEDPVLTDAEGRFEVRDLREGVYTLVAEGERGSAKIRSEGVTLGSSVTMRLEQLAGLEGRVVVGGKPVSNYSIDVKGPVSRDKSVRAKDGRFTMPRLEPGKYAISVTSDDGTATDEVEIQAGRTESVELALTGWGTARGIVVDARSGEALPGLMVMVVPEDGGASGESIMGMFTGMGPRTDGTGRFNVDKVGPGKNTIVILDKDVMTGALHSDSFEAEPGQDKDLGTISVIPGSDIPKDERGDLGMSTMTAKWDRRPTMPSEEDDDSSDQAPEPADPSAERLWVVSVVKDGPADKAGVQPGDEIVSIKGTTVASLGTKPAASLLSPAQLRAGDDIKLELDREGSTQTATVVARKRPE